MTVQFDKSLELSAKQLLADPRLATWTAGKLEVWLFDDLQARQALQADLKKHGIEAEVYSAYKPLLHFFIEKQNLKELARVEIHYPVHHAADRKRFLLEAYPLARMLQDTALTWIPKEANTSEENLYYIVNLTDHSGCLKSHIVTAPNQVVTDYLGQKTLCPTGMLRVTQAGTGVQMVCELFQTEIQQAYQQVIDWVTAYPWGNAEPYFGRMLIRIDIPGAEQFDTQGVILSSTLEALHEDLYFSILEFFQHHSGRPAGDRGLQPGQIVPDIRMGSECVRIQIRVYPAGEVLPGLSIDQGQGCHREHNFADVQDFSDLQKIDRPIRATAVNNLLHQFDAKVFESISHQARVIQSIVRPGTGPAIVLTGGQHANEPSGIVAALRAGEWLASTKNAHFALVPIENPDGYQLYEEYCLLHPQHMHHAARYTGLGDDLEYRECAPWYEKAARMHAVDATGAQLHLSLHGYPAHEWTRPFTGYVPRGFDLWSIPKGFFLIVRYQAAYKAMACEWIEKITSQIALIPGLAEFNAEQLQVYATHAGGVPFDIHHGIACLMVQNDSQPTGVKLVTEFPDETVLGEAFQFAQLVQTETVKIACEAWWQLHQAT